MIRPLRTALLAASIAALGLPAGAGAAPVLVVGDDGRASVVDDPALPPPAATRLPAPPAEARARGAQAPDEKKKKGPTVGEAIAKALAKATITPEQAERFQSIFNKAKSTRNRLGGSRRAALANVVGTVETLARQRNLTGTRMPAVFLQLQRNTEFWPSRAIPSPGTRIRFKGSEIVFEPYSGQGIQIQPFITGVAANELWQACNGGVPLNPELKCDQNRLRTVLDELAGLPADRGGFLAWEYYFNFGGGSPPWISSLSQGSIIQALARGAAYLNDPKYLPIAARALEAFERSQPVGLRTPLFGGSHYLIYSFNRGLKVLNAQIRALIGLFDYARITGSQRAQGLYVKGERSARVQTPRHDTGAWSLYSLGRNESNLLYHRVVRDFLRELCGMNAIPVYCTTADNFTRHLSEHPQIRLLDVAGARAGKPVHLTFRLSKISNVRLRVTRGDIAVFVMNRRVGYGKRSFAWTPRRAGDYDIKLEATDLLNHHEIARGSVTVRK